MLARMTVKRWTAAAILAATAVTTLAVGAGTAGKSPAGAGPAQGCSYTFVFRSGALSVNGSADKALLMISSELGFSGSTTLRLRNSAGSAVASKTTALDPGKTVSLTFDPGSTVKLRATISVTTSESPDAELLLPSFSVLTGSHTHAALDTFPYTATGVC